MRNKFNIYLEDIFSDFTAQTNLSKHLDNELVMSDFDTLMVRDPGRTVSNVGGWQSNPITMDSDAISDLSGIKEVFNLTVEFTDFFLKHATHSLCVKELSGWLSENPPGSYNSMHNHGSTDIVAVYYVDLPTDSLPLCLLRTDSFTQTALVGELKTQTGLLSVGAFTSDLVIFPGHLYHSVPINKSSRNRRSISMNISCGPRQN